MVFGKYKVVYLVLHAERRVFVLTVQHGRELPVTVDELSTAHDEDPETPKD